MSLPLSLTLPLLTWKDIPTFDFFVVRGYIRRHCHPSLFIPDDILNYIAIWYYDVSAWTLSGDALDTFFALQNGEAIYGAPFMIDGITFHCSLCPLGWKKNQHGFVQYYLEVKELPRDISSFTVFFEFFCFESRSSWKGIRTLTKINDAVGWFHYTLPYSECRQIVRDFGHSQLTFGVNVEVLNINYKYSAERDRKPCAHPTDECKSSASASASSSELVCTDERSLERIRYTQTRHLPLHRQTEKTWFLNQYPLSRFKHCLYPKNFHSPSFENDYWCFECQANFEHNGLVYCRLKLLRMPYFIKLMRVKCRLQSSLRCESDKEENGMDEKEDRGHWELVDMSFKHNYSKWKAYNYTTPSSSSSSSNNEHQHTEHSIRINVKIEIVELIDWTQRTVDMTEWCKYGVVDNCLFQPSMAIQYVEDIEHCGNEQYLTTLDVEDGHLAIHKSWIKPNYLNIPMEPKTDDNHIA
mmetsp:Transcript_40149/g.65880  ORF Transcript_40149/g.65880 Transcript_40149/m.65880 type:complete len:468 (-) Transcript_40149:181-1584(-)